MILLAVLATRWAAYVERLARTRRAAIVASTVAVNTAAHPRATSLHGADQSARAAAILPRFRTILNAVAASWNRASIGGRVAHLALTIGIGQAFLAVQTTLGTRDTPAVDVGFIAILHRIRAARLVAGLRRAIANLALTVLPRRRVGALETVRTG